MRRLDHNGAEPTSRSSIRRNGAGSQSNLAAKLADARSKLPKLGQYCPDQLGGIGRQPLFLDRNFNFFDRALRMDQDYDRNYDYDYE